eukprot:CAMPEP_0202698150 /NCGR_PEP_ID=MMETSP1385-20130828/11425_1 /ASSEMBLY_ACC=CAM_ASM_000861 /TAXON_ID=933848 /ORGANISM="Elphidium margaritaceum" /LENGTH=254 /DNA_ID=CAMNT_0049354785 /DNA_START=107 /DNA_END=871 /DNA_ORIENTATION=-
MSRAAFNSYEGVDCGYVYDGNLLQMYPLNVCITDYDATSVDSGYSYHSRKYQCNAEGTDVISYSWLDEECGEIADAVGSITALTPGDETFRCPSSGSTESAACYASYKKYMLDTNTSASDCEGWQSASYNTEFYIVGACLNGPETYQYARCQAAVSDDTETVLVESVFFNEETCCDLTYISTGNSAPTWHTTTVKLGCDATAEVYIGDWQCNIDEAADDADVFTDNTDPMCDSAFTYIASLAAVIALVCAAYTM